MDNKAVTSSGNSLRIEDFKNMTFEEQAKVVDDIFTCLKRELCKPHYIRTLIEEEHTELGIEYNKMKKEFELTHCKIVGRSFFIEERTDGIKILSEKKLKSLYKHLNYEFGNKKISFVEKWLRDPNMRLYDDMEWFLNPEECPSNIYCLKQVEHGYEIDLLLELGKITNEDYKNMYEELIKRRRERLKI